MISVCDKLYIVTHNDLTFHSMTGMHSVKQNEYIINDNATEMVGKYIMRNIIKQTPKQRPLSIISLYMYNTMQEQTVGVALQLPDTYSL